MSWQSCCESATLLWQGFLMMAIWNLWVWTLIRYLSEELLELRFEIKLNPSLNTGFSPATWTGVKMHTLISKCTEMCSLIENARLNLLNVPLNYLSKHSISNCLYVYSDVWGVTSSFYTFNAQECGTRCIKVCSLKKSWGDSEPWNICSIILS